MILDGEPGDLNWVREGHELQEVERDPVRRVLEAAVALAMSGGIGPSLLADRQHRRAPQLASVFVAHVDRLAGRVADRVIRPRRELVLTAVERPGVTRARFRDLKAKGRIRDHVDPGRRRPLSLAENRHVFTAVGSEAAEAIEELQFAAAAARHPLT